MPGEGIIIGYNGGRGCERSVAHTYQKLTQVTPRWLCQEKSTVEQNFGIPDLQKDRLCMTYRCDDTFMCQLEMENYIQGSFTTMPSGYILGMRVLLERTALQNQFENCERGSTTAG